MLVKEKFASLVRKFGTDRVLFGTDSPWADQSIYVDRLGTCGFSDSEFENIMAKNAVRLLGM